MRILINTPFLNLQGGVANHYIGLKAYWTEQVKYNVVGKRGSKRGKGIYWLPWDILKFTFRLFTFKPDVVMVNPSLGKSALKRDFLFLHIAHFLGYKTAVFIHGFDLEYAKQVNRQWVAHNLNRTKLIFVLAQRFKNELTDWGINAPIVLTTTKVDDRLIENFDINSRIGEIKNILFLTRIEKSKGIYEAIKSYEILRTDFPYLTLSIVGNGRELVAVKKYVLDNHISGVRFTGSLTGHALINEFIKGDLYLFPSYGEGMPTSVLEAMAFGLPVFTRNVGGLSDFFLNGQMGFITDSMNPEVYADAMRAYIQNPQLRVSVALYNHTYAREHFMASQIAPSIEKQLKKIL